MFSSKSDEWATPRGFFEKLNSLFGPFDLDVCANEMNHKCPKFFDKETNGLDQLWHEHGTKVFMNPPYGKTIKDWVAKAELEAQEGCYVLGLLPARTDTAWFHDHCAKHRVIFIKGRLAFESPWQDKPTSAPFPSMIVIWHPSDEAHK